MYVESSNWPGIDGVGRFAQEADPNPQVVRSLQRQGRIEDTIMSISDSVADTGLSLRADSPPRGDSCFHNRTISVVLSGAMKATVPSRRIEIRGNTRTP